MCQRRKQKIFFSLLLLFQLTWQETRNLFCCLFPLFCSPFYSFSIGRKRWELWTQSLNVPIIPITNVSFVPKEIALTIPEGREGIMETFPLGLIFFLFKTPCYCLAPYGVSLPSLIRPFSHWQYYLSLIDSAIIFLPLFPSLSQQYSHGGQALPPFLSPSVFCSCITECINCVLSSLAITLVVAITMVIDWYLHSSILFPCFQLYHKDIVQVVMVSVMWWQRRRMSTTNVGHKCRKMWPIIYCVFVC